MSDLDYGVGLRKMLADDRQVADNRMDTTQVSSPINVLPTPPATSNTTDGFSMQPPTQPRALNVPANDPVAGPSSRAPPPLTGLSRARLDSVTPATPITPVYKPQSPSIAMRPPPPDAPAPMPPPYPAPAIPQGLRVESAIPPPELSADEKRELWSERVKLLASAMQTKQRLEICDEKNKDAMIILQSATFTSLSDDEQKRIHEETSALATERDAAKQAFEDAVDKLTSYGSWPVAPPPSNSLEDELNKQHGEVVGYVQELHNTVTKMNELLGGISQLKQPPTIPLPIDEPDDEEDDAMEVDQQLDGPGPALPSRKRRRVSESIEDVSMSGPGAVASSADLPSHEDLESFLEQLVRLETQATTLANDVNEHGRDLREEFKSQVDTTLEEFQINFAKAQEEKEAQKVAEIEAREAAITAVQVESESLGAQVGEVADEMSDLVLKVGKLEVEVDTKKREREESYERVLKVEERLQSFQSTRETHTRSIETLEAALKAYKTRPPSPPASPRFPPPSYIVSELEPELIKAVRMNILPMMEEVRTDVETLVQEKHKEIVSIVWPRMELVAKVLHSVKERLDKDAPRVPQVQQMIQVPIAGPSNAVSR